MSLSSGARVIPSLGGGRSTPLSATSSGLHARAGGESLRSGLASAALLTVLVLAGHAWCLGDGLFLDDHWHQLRLRETGWSLAQLVSVTTIAPDSFIHCWWQERTTCWEYVRPFSVVFMKVMQIVTGGSLAAQHAASLLLHWATTLMVWRLCLRMTGHRGWSLVGGFLFGLYTHTMIPVAWLASQNALLQTLLTVGGLIVYARASRLDLDAGRERAGQARPGDDTHACGASPAARAIPPLHVPLFLITTLCMTLGMCTRENAVVMPVFVWAFDRAFGGRAHARARRGAHVFLAFLAAAFLTWRMAYAHHSVPDFYMRRPDGAEYPLWLLAKLMHYLCSAVWLTPMTVGPTGRFNPFTEVPGDCLLMFSILAVMCFGYYRACRDVRGWWIWPLWILLSVLPVTPIMATPHTGYMAGVGFAIAMVLGPGLRARVRPVGIGRWSPAVAAWFVFATLVYVPITRIVWNGMTAAENAAMAAVAAEPPPADVRDVYFVNLPFVNVYAPIQLRETWGPSAARPRYHVLSYAPELLRMKQPTRIEQLDDHRFAVSVEGARYFSGALGRYLVEGMRTSGRLRAGQVIHAEGFDVRIADADDQGVRALVYDFVEPLSSPRHRFYATTPTSDAAPLRFGDMASRSADTESVVDVTPQAADASALSASARLHRHINWLFAVRAAVARGIQTDLYFTGPPFPGPR